jgi:hypothetical protein
MLGKRKAHPHPRTAIVREDRCAFPGSVFSHSAPFLAQALGVVRLVASGAMFDG